MRVDRRTILAALTTGVAGCGGLSTTTETASKIRLDGSTVTAATRGCADEGSHAGSVSFGPTDAVVTVTGRFTTPTPCDSLSVSLFSSINDRSEDTVIVSVSSDPSDSCDRTCSGVVSYTARLRLSRSPAVVRLEHDPHGREPTSVGVFERETTADSTETTADSTEATADSAEATAEPTSVSSRKSTGRAVESDG